jgi:phosphoenolpyruvate carboxylase
MRAHCLLSLASACSLLVAFPCLVQSRKAFVPYGGASTAPSSKTLDVSLPLGSAPPDSDRDKKLMADIQLLSGILADIVKAEDPVVQDLYQQFRQFGLDRAADLNTSDITNKALKKMIAAASKLDSHQAFGVTRTFSIMLNLINSAEVQHRNRIMRQHEAGSPAATAEEGPLPLIEDSVRGTMETLLQSGQATPDEIYNQLTQQKVEIVLTAHPTQVQRKSLLIKYRQISELLAYLERTDIDGFEKSAAVADLRRIVSSIWGADEIRRQKPTPQQEAAGGNAILESVLWDAVPAYLRKLDSQCRITLNRRLPLEVVPIKFASWIGGDRDGNPNVTPVVTKEVVLQQRLRAARLLLKDMYALLSDLAISSRFSPAMEELAASITDSHHTKEKYRRVIGYLIKRLVKTAVQCEEELAGIASSPSSSSSSILRQAAVDKMTDGWHNVEPIHDAADLMEPLRIMYDSLVETGFDLVADGLLVDIIRRLAVFGMSLVPLDIREESTKHTEALDALTRWLGIGSYSEWDEEARLAWLTSELSNKRPLFRSRDMETLGFNDSVVKTLQTFYMASGLHAASLGAYVISQAQQASDVLAVMLLQKQFGMTATSGKMMRVVPLFETLDDLNRGSSVIETLFTIPLYVGAVKGKQEVMVGYSDSAKDAGRLSACWAQFNSQESMAKVATKYGIELTFFHGKGGTVGRGGNPSAYRAIMSHPPNTVNGRFRVTEQGEMITQNFGAPSIAERTLDIYTAAVLHEHFSKHVEPSKKWRDEMKKVSEVSCADYRHLVREEPRFVPYFRQATPELELGSLNIGSRPAKRNPTGGIESLRAIPWTFAWTQTRTHLSAWLGVGAGLHTTDLEEMATLQEMYTQWPWFRETIDLITMILAKTDFSISAHYDEQLVDKTGGLMKLGEEMRDKLVLTRESVLEVTQSKDFAGAHSALMRASSTIRHPYVDPVNVIQAELLKRLRAIEKKRNLSPEETESSEVLKDAIIVSINAIAQGMRNSG